MQSDTPERQLVIECIDRNFPGPELRRILVDPSQREVIFENCFWPRGFLSPGYEADRVCPFEEIFAARDFGFGNLRRLYISTRHGRCAVSPDWNGFDELRTTLQKIRSVTPNGHWLDDPRILMPLLFLLVFGIVGLIIYFLL